MFNIRAFTIGGRPFLGGIMMKVATFLTDGFETVEALAVVDILRRAGVMVSLVSITGALEVTSAQHIVVKADTLIEDMDCDGVDVLFLPGGPGHTSYIKCDKLITLLKEFDALGKRIAAICAAPSVLGMLGMLRGRRAMVFPGFEEQLEGAILVTAPERVVTDGHITTSRGMGTSIDLGLELVKLLKGEKLAAELAVSTQYA